VVTAQRDAAVAQIRAFCGAQPSLSGGGDRLGNESPAHHLVVAALGAVASNPGPRGRKLITQLQQSAELDVGMRQEHAILALAATRLRPAIETLIELSRTLPQARGAAIVAATAVVTGSVITESMLDRRRRALDNPFRVIIQRQPGSTSSWRMTAIDIRKWNK
jgi:hypothetical protein